MSQEEVKENAKLFDRFVLELSHQIAAKQLTDARVSRGQSLLHILSHAASHCDSIIANDLPKSWLAF